MAIYEYMKMDRQLLLMMYIWTCMSAGTVQVKHAYCNTTGSFFCTAQYIDNLVGNLYYFCNGKRPAGRYASRLYMLYIDLQQNVPGSQTISSNLF
jgi:hypothetical protein